MLVKRMSKYILFVLGALLTVVYIKLSENPDVKKKASIQSLNNIKNINFRDYETVTVSATQFYQGDIIKNLLQGKNYRSSWETQVEVPILFLDTLKGGVTIIKEGGGNQTKSLRLKASNEALLTLRSVNKNPNPLVPEYLKNLGLEGIVTDGISGQHPYSALIVSKLSEAIHLDHTNPKLVFLPKQNSLGKSYNKTYGNRIFFLEYENKGNYNWTKYDSVITIVDTEDLQLLKKKVGSSLSVDKKQLIKARLFDIIIGDWDRHSKQWGWIVTKTKNGLNAIPLPTDRDNAFFDIEGLINNLITNETITPHLQNFEKDVNHIRGLVYDFDVYFLQKTSYQDFISQANYIKHHLTDNKIQEAFRQWNEELYKLHGEEIINKIKARRDNIESIAIEFKKILNTKPLLMNPLKGSENSNPNDYAIPCFEC